MGIPVEAKYVGKEWLKKKNKWLTEGLLISVYKYHGINEWKWIYALMNKNK